MICSYYQELISRMLDEDLTPVEQSMLKAHLPNCEACAAMYNSFEALSRALEDQMEEPPEALRYNVMAEIRREAIRKKNRLSRPMQIVLSTAACLALIVGISLGSGVLHSKGAATAASQSTAVLADSNLQAVTRGAAYEAAPAESEEAAALYEADLYEAEETAEAPAAAYAAAESAAGAANKAMVSDSAMAADSGVAVFDLSDRMSREELLAFLGGERLDGGLSAAPAATLLVSDGDSLCEISVFVEADELFYSLPESGVYRAACSADALEALLNG